MDSKKQHSTFSRCFHCC